MKKYVFLLGFLGLGLVGCATQEGPSDKPQTAIEQPKAVIYPTIGSNEWYTWVSQASGVIDAQGHGPDFGSEEWCGAVQFRVFRQRVPTTDICTNQWKQKVHQALIKQSESKPAQ